MAKEEKKPSVLHSFLGGLLFTIVLVVVIPVVTAILIQPIVEDMFEDQNYGVLTSSLIVTLVMLVLMILFILLLGGGAILRKYGLIGVIGLIAAYWFLGNVWGAALPIAILVLFAVFSHYREKKKAEKRSKKN
jgi:ACR3 family arsenite efflux pump ArsB